MPCAAPRKRDENFGFVYDGYVRAPADGVYAFELASDDGSRLLVHGAIVVDHDGPHSYTPKPGYVALRKGLHPIQVQYFEIAGDQELTLDWIGPDIEKQRVPAAALFRAE